MKRPRGCRNGGVGGVRNRKPSTVSDKNGGGEGAGVVKVTSAGGHVVGGACVKEPLRGAWWRRRNTGGVQRRVQRLVVPGSAVAG
jgi:hypothetical protein